MNWEAHYHFTRFIGNLYNIRGYAEYAHAKAMHMIALEALG